jgi:hypothetical protein
MYTYIKNCVHVYTKICTRIPHSSNIAYDSAPHLNGLSVIFQISQCRQDNVVCNMVLLIRRGNAHYQCQRISRCVIVGCVHVGVIECLHVLICTGPTIDTFLGDV